MSSPTFFFEDPQRLAQPAASYAYHRENQPVYHYTRGQSWVIFRYADVDALLHDPRLSNRRAAGMFGSAPPDWRDRLAELQPIFEGWMLMKDGAEHTAVRQAFKQYFSERSVAAMESTIQAVIDELLGGLRRDGKMDFAAELAYQLPVRIISNLLRVRSEDRAMVVRWSDHLSEFFNTIPPSPQNCQNVLESTRQMVAYVRSALDEARRQPGDDLLSHVTAISDDLLVANAVVLLVAGHETTRLALGSCLSLLLSHPDQWELLQRQPELLRGAVEEALRLEPANPIMGRIATQAVEVGGQTIRPGDLVLLSLGSANRDPAQFADPDRFDITRKPGKHLAMGSGPHYCLGSLLAHKEIQLTIRTLLQEFPNLRLDPDHPTEWLSLPGIRGPRSLSVLA